MIYQCLTIERFHNMLFYVVSMMSPARIQQEGPVIKRKEPCTYQRTPADYDLALENQTANA